MNKVYDKPTTLCQTCTWGTMAKGRRNTYMHCSQFNNWIRDEITDCNEYKDRTAISKRDLYSMAWLLRTDKKARAIGFIPPNSERPRRMRELHELLEDDD